MKKLAVSTRTRFFLWVILSVFLIFFRARWALRPGGYDEDCYLQWLHWFLGLTYPRCYSPSHSPGIAVVWWPMGLVALAISRTFSVAFISAVKPLVSLYSFALWGASLFLIDAILRKLRTKTDPPVPLWLPVAILANVRLLEYAAKNNFWTHPAEMAVALGAVLACLHRRYFTALFLSTLVCFIRLNDAPIFLVVFGSLLDAYRRGEIKLLPRTQKWFVTSAALLGGIFGFYIYDVGFVSGYNAMTIPIIIQNFSPARYASAFVMAYDGLFWVAGWFLLVVALGLFYFRRLSYTARGAWLWMAAELGLVVGLCGIRDDYGSPVWRYFMGSFAGGLILWTELSRLLDKRVRNVAVALLVFYAIWLPYQMYTFDAETIHRALHVEFKVFTSGGPMVRRLEFLLHPSALIKLLGQGPVGFTLYSWLTDLPRLAFYQPYAKYALRRAELWAMTLVTLSAVIMWFSLTLTQIREWRAQRPERRKSGQLQKRATL